jgi:hypothetical protein
MPFFFLVFHILSNDDVERTHQHNGFLCHGWYSHPLGDSRTGYLHEQQNQTVQGLLTRELQNKVFSYKRSV